jgi:hypothetical protein
MHGNAGLTRVAAAVLRCASKRRGGAQAPTGKQARGVEERKLRQGSKQEAWRSAAPTGKQTRGVAERKLRQGSNQEAWRSASSDREASKRRVGGHDEVGDVALPHTPIVTPGLDPGVHRAEAANAGAGGEAAWIAGSIPRSSRGTGSGDDDGERGTPPHHRHSRAGGESIAAEKGAKRLRHDMEHNPTGAKRGSRLCGQYNR